MDDQLMSATDGSTTIEGQSFVRRRLGRGISALLGGAAQANVGHDESNSISAASARAANHDPNQIHVELIERNPFQPRKDFDPESLNELIESIRQHGVLQPVLVRPCAGNYQLIAGERRWMAAKAAGLDTIPCRVLELEDRAMCEAALEENLKRKDLNVLEKAQAFQDYMNRFGVSMDDLAKQLSMNRSSVCNFLRILELSDFVKEALTAERITFGHARALLSLTADGQATLCKRIEAESMSVRQTEAAVRELLKTQKKADGETIPFPSGENPAARDLGNHVRSLQDQLRQLFGVNVEIKLSAKEKGKIVIPFASNDDFERILRHLRRAA